MCSQVGDDLVSRDALVHGRFHVPTVQMPDDQVRIPDRDVDEQVQNRNLELVRGIGVHAVVGFEDEEALVIRSRRSVDRGVA